MRLNSTMLHRGPDDSGSWSDADVGLTLAQTRLAIIDLSRQGHQPMVSSDERWVITFNGEIYNYPELVGELSNSNISLRGHSDTEAALEYIAHFGLEAALSRFNGMFAIALWDARKRQLHLVRDRVGIKPLYYGNLVGTWIFASELKAVAALPERPRRIDVDALGVFMRHGYITDDACIFSDMKKVQPGEVVTISIGQGDTERKTFWSLRDRITEDGRSRAHIDPAEAIDILHEEISRSVQRRMIADVPVGAFLSGGIDSSLVVALMQKSSSFPVRTFTVGFREKAFDESEYARAIAAELGTQHTEFIVTANDALALVGDLPTIYDEPFADPSELPTILISRLASDHVKVVLSGDGGDELFGGYTRYQRVAGLRRVLHRVPAFLGKPLTLLQYGLPRYSSMSNKVRRFAALLNAPDGAGFYRAAISMVQDASRIVPRARDSAGRFGEVSAIDELETFAEQMMYTDFVTYLPGDILTKVDRASMNSSLEARVPLLDHNLVEAAWRMPAALRADSRDPKSLLKGVLYQHLDASLFDRPKRGFSVPLAMWLRGPLRKWAEQLLAQGRPADIISFEELERCWAAFLAGHDNQTHTLWNALTFLSWHQAWCNE